MNYPLIGFLVCFIVFGAGCADTQNTPRTEPAQVDSSTTLDLKNQGLAQFPMYVVAQTNLVTLNLAQNQLTGAPPSQIGQLRQLVHLDLSNNRLTGLPAELGQLKKLETLNVANNRLTGLPLELGNLTQLRVLDVSGNPYAEQDLATIAERLPNTTIKR
ncbi:MAG: leucine-rich repeat domain-containing protein [Patescibacteria group bacterium]